MKIYNCRVRLAGLVHHEVPKFGITEKEVIVLRTVHGTDAVNGIKNAGEAKRTDEVEYQRLADFYGAELVQNIFKISLGDLSIDDSDIDDEDDVELLAPVKSGKKVATDVNPVANGVKQLAIE